jgi:hypothetical protein
MVICAYLLYCLQLLFLPLNCEALGLLVLKKVFLVVCKTLMFVLFASCIFEFTGVLIFLFSDARGVVVVVAEAEPTELKAALRASHVHAALILFDSAIAPWAVLRV